jgi:hypothetical protein
MNPTPAAASEFDDFLYAPIVVESNGMLLSVLSALARLNVDPWEEAARLARLPCEVATRTLMKLIAALPNGLSEGLDAGALARELVALLPRQGGSHDRSAQRGALADLSIVRTAVTGCLVLYLLLAAIVFCSAMARGARSGNGSTGRGRISDSEYRAVAGCRLRSPQRACPVIKGCAGSGRSLLKRRTWSASVAAAATALFNLSSLAYRRRMSVEKELDHRELATS